MDDQTRVLLRGILQTLVFVLMLRRCDGHWEVAGLEA
jgi:hypothetical protein